MKMQEAACQALQEATEMYMVHLFEDPGLCAINVHLITI